MLNPIELKIKNIGRFVTEQVVSFDGLGNLVQIDGENRNTGGSSGSGKSTFFNALDYLLGLNDIPVTVLQSRLTKEGILVTGTFDWDGKTVEIVRGKGKFSVTIDGTLVEGSAKLVEEKIDEILGMSRDLFRPILHKRQKEGGFFLNMTPAKLNEFLTDCLGLSEYRLKLELIDKEAKLLETKKTKLEADLQAARAGLAATQEAILALGLAPVRDIHQSVVLDLKAKFEASNAKLAIVTADHNTQNKILEAQRPVLPEIEIIPHPKLIPHDFDATFMEQLKADKAAKEKEISDFTKNEMDRQVKVNQAIQERKIQLSTLTYKEANAQKATVEAKALAQEVAKVRACECPTCAQPWITEAAKAHENSLVQKILALKVQIDEGNAATLEINKINMEIELLTRELATQINPNLEETKKYIASLESSIVLEVERQNNYTNDIARKNNSLLAEHQAAMKAKQDAHQAASKAANDEYAIKQQALRHTQSIEADMARGQADVDRRALEAAIAKLQAYTEASSRYDTTLASLKEKELANGRLVTNATEDIVVTEKNVIYAEEAKRAVKSYMSCSFEDALEEIGDAATDIIRAIPNMANSTVQFQGTRETGSGKVKEEVNAVITMDGEEGIPIKSLSGGERSSVDLAIDLAVIDLIENRSNKGVGVFILDEPFTGLDTVSIEMVLEVLKNSKINKKLIIVDHNPEVKQMVESRLVVVRQGLTSEITQ